MLKSLKPILEILDDIADTSSRNEKSEILETYLKDKVIGPTFKKVLRYTLDPFLKYHVTDLPQVKLTSTKVKPRVDDIFTYLDYLASKTGCTDFEKSELLKFASIDLETIEVVRRIIGKSLKCGLNTKIVQKYLTELPEHSLMLCEDDVDKFLKLVNKFSDILVSPKLDGVRAWAMVDKNGNVKFISRKGLEFRNFQILYPEVEKFAKLTGLQYPIVLDGEVISKDKKFQKLMTQISRHSELDPSIFEFHIFDVVVNGRTLEDRLKLLKKTYMLDKFEKVNIVPHLSTLTCKEDIEKKRDEYIDKYGYEGLVLKLKDSHYEYKRSRKWLKVKKFDTLDLKIIGTYPGKGKHTGKLGGFYVDFKGVKVKVGSGLNDSQRIEFLENNMIGKIIEIKYQEITRDGSLRHPTFIRIREDKKTISC